MFLVIGDPHFQSNNANQTNILHQDILKIIENRKPSSVVILGDLLHRHEKIDLYPFRRVENFLMDIHKTGVELFVLVGNHDRPHNKVYMTDEHPFNSFKLWPRTHIIDRCAIFERDDCKFICIPYVPNGMCLQALQDCGFSDDQMKMKMIDLVFCHSEFTGCKINKISGGKCDIWPIDYPFNIAGHIHDYEAVGDNLLYVGTPFQQTFSERNDKGVHLVSFDEEKNISIEKIVLSIPPKISMTIDYREIYSIIIPPGEVKIKIVGPTLEVKKLLITPELADKFSQVRIVYSDTAVIKEIPKSKNMLSFSERLPREMEKDNDMLLSFYLLFGNTIANQSNQSNQSNILSI